MDTAKLGMFGIYAAALSLGAALLAPAAALAHPETGLLPDAVAETEYRVVLDINPKDIQTRNKLGVVLWRKNRLKEAEREFLEVLGQAGRDFDAHEGMGLVKLKEKKFGDAVGWFQRAIAINPGDTDIYLVLGQGLEQLGRFREAEEGYRKGLEVNARNLSRGTDRELEENMRGLLTEALNRLKRARGGI